VLVVRTHGKAKERITGKAAHLRGQAYHILFILCGCNSGQLWEDGFSTLLIEPDTVYTHAIKISHFLSVRPCGMFLAAKGFYQRLDLLLVLLTQFVERTVACILIGDGVGLLPSTRGILIETFAGSCSGIHKR